MTTRKKPAESDLRSDLQTFYEFATEMRAKGAVKVMICRGEGIDYVVEFEASEEQPIARSAIGFGFHGADESDECEDED